MEPAGGASEPAGGASEPAGRASEPAGRASEPAGRASEPAWSSPALRAPEPGGRPQGGDGERERERKKNTERSWYVVVPYVIVPYGAAAQKGGRIAVFVPNSPPPSLSIMYAADQPVKMYFSILPDFRLR